MKTLKHERPTEILELLKMTREMWHCDITLLWDTLGPPQEVFGRQGQHTSFWPQKDLKMEKRLPQFAQTAAKNREIKTTSSSTVFRMCCLLLGHSNVKSFFRKNTTHFFSKKIQIQILARWAPTSCKWSYNPYKFYKWITGDISPHITWVIVTVLTASFLGPPCRLDS